MGAEVVDFHPGGEVPAGARCRFCARLLDQPATPDRMTPHCGTAGCSTCTECAAGVTSVSPLHSHLVVAVLAPPDGDSPPQGSART